jgi:hypothetical protein
MASLIDRVLDQIRDDIVTHKDLSALEELLEQCDQKHLHNYLPEERREPEPDNARYQQKVYVAYQITLEGSEPLTESKLAEQVDQIEFHLSAEPSNWDVDVVDIELVEIEGFAQNLVIVEDLVDDLVDDLVEDLVD